MAIFIDADSRVIVQGMTGSEGMKHTTRMLASGTTVVGGVNPRKAGTSVAFDGTDVPVFGSVTEAVAATGANVSVIFVPPAHTKGAVVEAIEAGVPLVVIITEGVPVADSAEFFTLAQAKGSASSARTAPASSAPASPTSASSRPTSRVRARSASCRSPAP
ncbi:hypothetical protein GCM10025875_21940 [Litorihabitans aurantiacus]|uniref:CoA-binding domain-containing protein n=1 Tax=Litorihabitans aurantiacus TaxID=1930061 RepID=A0AA38CTY0_9MICO|nr:hypothetical protein GCM10025875_21940 [Litorihabitans aurantiacus]